MFDIKITGGDSLSGAVNQAVNEGIADLERKARSVRCRAHGRPVTTKRTRSGLEIDGCCQEAIDRAAASL